MMYIYTNIVRQNPIEIEQLPQFYFRAGRGLRDREIYSKTIQPFSRA